MTAAPDVARIAGPRVFPPAQPRRPTSHTLLPEVLADAARRVGWAALIYAGGVVLGHFGRRLLIAASGSVDIAFRASDLLGLAMVAMGLAVYGLSRSGLVSTTRLLGIGLVFEVLGALGIAAGPIVDHVPQIPTRLFAYVPAECVWIVLFPLVVPSTPTLVLMTSLLAASMGPLASVLGATFGGTPIQHPLEFGAIYLTTNYLCAGVAYLVARVVHGFGMQLKQLREIGSYELLDRIGQGGMGEVWRARHLLLARPAAIKLIRADVLGSSAHTRDAFIRRFEREAQETAQLGSTHTVDIFDFGVTESGDFYYVMELLEGISLERYVELFGPMEPPRVMYVVRQVLHSLGEAHRRGLVHRDVKPANILLCRLGPDDDFVKVLDFGLVKHFDASAATLLTQDGATAGTPAYMAPEIALGRGDVDGRADLYALGCVAYYLLTGQPVFAGDSDIAMVLAHVQNAPVSPSLRSEFNIPPALETFILQCLAKDPSARPASAEESDRRIAAIDVPDAWTGEKAHAWWELHRVEFGHSTTVESQERSDTEAETESRRCWPSLERRSWSSAWIAGH
jgi:eukaryotic-like serine/threonine-protein kinase